MSSRCYKYNKKGGHRACFHDTRLKNTAILATLTIAAHSRCWTNLARFYKCNPWYNAEPGVILWLIHLCTWQNEFDWLWEYLSLQNRFNLSVDCSTRNGSSFRTIVWNCHKTGQRFLLIFLLLHEDSQQKIGNKKWGSPYSFRRK